MFELALLPPHVSLEVVDLARSVVRPRDNTLSMDLDAFSKGCSREKRGLVTSERVRRDAYYREARPSGPATAR